jgi:carboxyl-terminal processing protease
MGDGYFKQQVYRINGGSTQLEGVSSDIMPDRYAYLKMEERC